MPYRIKSRLTDLGKYQVDLIEPLKQMGFNTSPSELCNALKGRCQNKKSLDLVRASNEIVTKWENRSEV